MQTGAQQISDIGAVWTRQNSLFWPTIEPSPGDRKWESVSQLEANLRQASASSLNAILIIRGTPTWAQKMFHSTCGPIKEDKFAQFGQFVYEAVLRYSQPPYNVKYFEIGNEVDALTYLDPDDWFGCWADAEDPVYRGGGYYASMLKVVYPLVKAANPQAQVLLGGFLADCDPVHPPNTTADCSYVRFFEGILREGGAAYFDGVSFHSYDFYYETPGHWGNANWNSAYNKMGPSLIPKARYYKSVLSAYNVTGKYILDTEAALICFSCTPGTQHEVAKTWFIPELYAAGIAEGLRGVLWFSYEGWNGSELVDSNSKLLPSAEAIRVAHAKFGNATYLGPIVPSDVGTVGVVGYKFKQGNRTLWLLRSYDTRNWAIALKTLPTSISDPLDTPIQPTTSLTLTLKPLYIEWVANTDQAVDLP